MKDSEYYRGPWKFPGKRSSFMCTETLKVKDKKPGQRACDEKDAKGELCVGHLKRWYYYHPLRLSFSAEQEEARKQFGEDAELCRCERCHTLYRPVAADTSTAGQKFHYPSPKSHFGAISSARIPNSCTRSSRPAT